MAAYTGPVTPDLIRYHVIPGRVTAGSIGSDMRALNGGTLKYERKFRKTFVNDAIIGQQEFGGSSYPIDVACDNGLIHAISVVLEPQ
jgi:uncharacterized surface protein with fasciclin (FAS1) repeats